MYHTILCETVIQSHMSFLNRGLYVVAAAAVTSTVACAQCALFESTNAIETKRNETKQNERKKNTKNRIQFNNL